jgi:hypothetical protein
MNWWRSSRKYACVAECAPEPSRSQICYYYRVQLSIHDRSKGDNGQLVCKKAF